jgi:hypothetical protein
MRSLLVATLLGILLMVGACTLDVAAPSGADSPPALPTTASPGPAQGVAPTVTLALLPVAPGAPTLAPATKEVEGGAPDQWPPVVEMVHHAFAQELGLEDGEVSVVAADQCEWPDDCLGAALPGEACGGGRVVGYRVVLELAGERYTYHTDEAGALVRPVMPEGLGEAETLLLWTREDATGCAMAMVSETRAEFGPCSGLALRGMLTPAQQTTVRDWVARFAPFEAQTPAGYVQLAGRGAVQATPDEQRQVAEWAARVGQEIWQGQN